MLNSSLTFESGPSSPSLIPIHLFEQTHAEKNHSEAESIMVQWPSKKDLCNAESAQGERHGSRNLSANSVASLAKFWAFGHLGIFHNPGQNSKLINLYLVLGNLLSLFTIGLCFKTTWAFYS